MMSAIRTTDAVDRRPSAPSSDCFAIWSVKSSFCRYIAALTDGLCAVSDDVRVIDADRLLLPGRMGGSESVLVWTSPAVLRFTGHGGLLSIELRELSLEIRAESGSLWIAPERGESKPVRIARAAVGGRSDSTLVVELTLTADGAAVFGNYLAGEPLDPIHLLAERLPERGWMQAPALSHERKRTTT